MTRPLTRARSLAIACLAALALLAACSAGTTPASTSRDSPSTHPASPTPTPTPHPEDDERGKPGATAFSLELPGTDTDVAGYTNPSSGTPGTPVRLYVSTPEAEVALTAYRIGAYAGSRAREVWHGTIPGQVQPAAQIVGDTRTVVAPWTESTTLDTTQWPPGFYLIELKVPSGAVRMVPYVVRSTSMEGRVVLVSPTTTWQAYNLWGGRSLYAGPGGFGDRSYAVSYDRPYENSGAGAYLWADLPFVLAAEATGVKLAYLTDVDIEADPAALTGAAGAVSIGHDEYWTADRRDRWDAARDAGTNELITAANAMYWRVRLEDGPTGTGPHRLVTAYKQASHPQAPAEPPPAPTLLKLDPGANPPEKSIGLRYECYPASVAFTVTDPSWWGYAGTGVTAGTQFPHLMGIEADRYYPLATTPHPMRLLANQEYTCNGVPTSAQAVEYAAASGAVVINLNAMRWSCALTPGCTDFAFHADQAVSDFATTVTANILQEFAKGPVAQRHPVDDTIATLQVPAERTVYPDP